MRQTSHSAAHCDRPSMPAQKGKRQSTRHKIYLALMDKKPHSAPDLAELCGTSRVGARIFELRKIDKHLIRGYWARDVYWYQLVAFATEVSEAERKLFNEEYPMPSDIKERGETDLRRENASFRDMVDTREAIMGCLIEEAGGTVAVPASRLRQVIAMGACVKSERVGSDMVFSVVLPPKLV